MGVPPYRFFTRDVFGDMTLQPIRTKAHQIFAKHAEQCDLNIMFNIYKLNLRASCGLLGTFAYFQCNKQVEQHSNTMFGSIRVVIKQSTGRSIQSDVIDPSLVHVEEQLVSVFLDRLPRVPDSMIQLLSLAYRMNTGRIANKEKDVTCTQAETPNMETLLSFRYCGRKSSPEYPYRAQCFPHC